MNKKIVSPLLLFFFSFSQASWAGVDTYSLRALSAQENSGRAEILTKYFGPGQNSPNVLGNELPDVTAQSDLEIPVQVQVTTLPYDIIRRSARSKGKLSVDSGFVRIKADSTVLGPSGKSVSLAGVRYLCNALIGTSDQRRSLRRSLRGVTLKAYDDLPTPFELSEKDHTLRIDRRLINAIRSENDALCVLTYLIAGLLPNAAASMPEGSQQTRLETIIDRVSSRAPWKDILADYISPASRASAQEKLLKELASLFGSLSSMDEGDLNPADIPTPDDSRSMTNPVLDGHLKDYEEALRAFDLETAQGSLRGMISSLDSAKAALNNIVQMQDSGALQSYTITFGSNTVSEQIARLRDLRDTLRHEREVDDRIKAHLEEYSALQTELESSIGVQKVDVLSRVITVLEQIENIKFSENLLRDPVRFGTKENPITLSEKLISLRAERQAIVDKQEAIGRTDIPERGQKGRGNEDFTLRDAEDEGVVGIARIVGTRGERALGEYNQIAKEALTYEEELLKPKRTEYGQDRAGYIKYLRGQMEDLGSRMRSRIEEETSHITDRKARKKAVNAIEREFMAESLAITSETMAVTTHQRPYFGQLVAAIALCDGKIAEQYTGEGKGLVVAMGAIFKALRGGTVHVATATSQLAMRDAEDIASVLDALGMSVGIANNDQSPEVKKAGYSKTITFGTLRDFGFDHLRDNTATSSDHITLTRPRQSLICDEVDSELIGSARSPLIISGRSKDLTPQQKEGIVKINEITLQLIQASGKNGKPVYYRIKDDGRRIEWTEEAKDILERVAKKLVGNRDLNTELGDLTFFQRCGNALSVNVEAINEAQGKIAYYNEQYTDGYGYIADTSSKSVILLNGESHQRMEGNQYSDGIHQALEAKHASTGIELHPEHHTTASITVPGLFDLYEDATGTTATAAQSADTFDKVYGLEVVRVPTRQQVPLTELSEKFFENKSQKYDAIVADVVEMALKCKRADGAVDMPPVLIGTESPAETNFLYESIYEALRQAGISVDILQRLTGDSSNDLKPRSDIMRDAGKRGFITVSQILSRGENIKLESLVEERSLAGELSESLSRSEEGLHVVGVSHNASKAVDKQLVGRAARHSSERGKRDPGTYRFYSSIEDLIFTANGRASQVDEARGYLTKLGLDQGQDTEGRPFSGLVSIINEIQISHEEKTSASLKEQKDMEELVNRNQERFYEFRQNILSLVSSGDINAKEAESVLAMLDEEWSAYLKEISFLRDAARLKASFLQKGNPKDLIDIFNRDAAELFYGMMDSIRNSAAAMSESIPVTVLNAIVDAHDEFTSAADLDAEAELPVTFPIRRALRALRVRPLARAASLISGIVSSGLASLAAAAPSAVSDDNGAARSVISSASSSPDHALLAMAAGASVATVGALSWVVKNRQKLSAIASDVGRGLAGLARRFSDRFSVANKKELAKRAAIPAAAGVIGAGLVLALTPAMIPVALAAAGVIAGGTAVIRTIAETKDKAKRLAIIGSLGHVATMYTPASAANGAQIQQVGELRVVSGQEIFEDIQAWRDSQKLAQEFQSLVRTMHVSREAPQAKTLKTTDRRSQTADQRPETAGQIKQAAETAKVRTDGYILGQDGATAYHARTGKASGFYDVCKWDAAKDGPGEAIGLAGELHIENGVVASARTVATFQQLTRESTMKLSHQLQDIDPSRPARLIKCEENASLPGTYADLGGKTLVQYTKTDGSNGYIHVSNTDLPLTTTEDSLSRSSSTQSFATSSASSEQDITTLEQQETAPRQAFATVEEAKAAAKVLEAKLTDKKSNTAPDKKDAAYYEAMSGLYSEYINAVSYVETNATNRETQEKYAKARSLAEDYKKLCQTKLALILVASKAREEKPEQEPQKRLAADLPGDKLEEPSKPQEPAPETKEQAKPQELKKAMTAAGVSPEEKQTAPETKEEEKPRETEKVTPSTEVLPGSERESPSAPTDSTPSKDTDKTTKRPDGAAEGPAGVATGGEKSDKKKVPSVAAPLVVRTKDGRTVKIESRLKVGHGGAAPNAKNTAMQPQAVQPATQTPRVADTSSVDQNPDIPDNQKTPKPVASSDLPLPPLPVPAPASTAPATPEQPATTASGNTKPTTKLKIPPSVQAPNIVRDQRETMFGQSRRLAKNVMDQNNSGTADPSGQTDPITQQIDRLNNNTANREMSQRGDSRPGNELDMPMRAPHRKGPVQPKATQPQAAQPATPAPATQTPPVADTSSVDQNPDIPDNQKTPKPVASSDLPLPPLPVPAPASTAPATPAQPAKKDTDKEHGDRKDKRHSKPGQHERFGQSTDMPMQAPGQNQAAQGQGNMMQHGRKGAGDMGMTLPVQGQVPGMQMPMAGPNMGMPGQAGGAPMSAVGRGRVRMATPMGSGIGSGRVKVGSFAGKPTPGRVRVGGFETGKGVLQPGPGQTVVSKSGVSVTGVAPAAPTAQNASATAASNFGIKVPGQAQVGPFTRAQPVPSANGQKHGSTAVKPEVEVVSGRPVQPQQMRRRGALVVDVARDKEAAEAYESADSVTPATLNEEQMKKMKAFYQDGARAFYEKGIKIDFRGVLIVDRSVTDEIVRQAREIDPELAGMFEDMIGSVDGKKYTGSAMDEFKKIASDMCKRYFIPSGHILLPYGEDIIGPKEIAKINLKVHEGEIKSAHSYEASGEDLGTIYLLERTGPFIPSSERLGGFSYAGVAFTYGGEESRTITMHPDQNLHNALKELQKSELDMDILVESAEIHEASRRYDRLHGVNGSTEDKLLPKYSSLKNGRAQGTVISIALNAIADSVTYDEFPRVHQLVFIESLIREGLESGALTSEDLGNDTNIKFGFTPFVLRSVLEYKKNQDESRREEVYRALTLVARAFNARLAKENGRQAIADIAEAAAAKHNPGYRIPEIKRSGTQEPNRPAERSDKSEDAAASEKDSGLQSTPIADRPYLLDMSDDMAYYPAKGSPGIFYKHVWDQESKSPGKCIGLVANITMFGRSGVTGSVTIADVETLSDNAIKGPYLIKFKSAGDLPVGLKHLASLKVIQYNESNRLPRYVYLNNGEDRGDPETLGNLNRYSGLQEMLSGMEALNWKLNNYEIDRDTFDREANKLRLKCGRPQNPPIAFDQSLAGIVRGLEAFTSDVMLEDRNISLSENSRDPVAKQIQLLRHMYARNEIDYPEFHRVWARLSERLIREEAKDIHARTGEYVSGVRNEMARIISMVARLNDRRANSAATEPGGLSIGEYEEVIRRIAVLGDAIDEIFRAAEQDNEIDISEFDTYRLKLREIEKAVFTEAILDMTRVVENMKSVQQSEADRTLRSCEELIRMAGALRVNGPEYQIYLRTLLRSMKIQLKRLQQSDGSADAGQKAEQAKKDYAWLVPELPEGLRSQRALYEVLETRSGKYTVFTIDRTDEQSKLIDQGRRAALENMRKAIAGLVDRLRSDPDMKKEDKEALRQRIDTLAQLWLDISTINTTKINMIGSASIDDGSYRPLEGYIGPDGTLWLSPEILTDQRGVAGALIRLALDSARRDSEARRPAQKVSEDVAEPNEVVSEVFRVSSDLTGYETDSILEKSLIILTKERGQGIEPSGVFETFLRMAVSHMVSARENPLLVSVVPLANVSGQAELQAEAARQATIFTNMKLRDTAQFKGVPIFDKNDNPLTPKLATAVKTPDALPQGRVGPTGKGRAKSVATGANSGKTTAPNSKTVVRTVGEGTPASKSSTGGRTKVIDGMGAPARQSAGPKDAKAKVTPMEMYMQEIEAGAISAPTAKALEAMGDLAMPAVRKALASADDSVRRAGVNILCEISKKDPDQRMVALLAGLLNDQNVDIRIAASKALSSFVSSGNLKAIEWMRVLLNKSGIRPDISEHEAGLFADMGRVALPAIEAAVESRDPDVRLAGVIIAAKLVCNGAAGEAIPKVVDSKGAKRSVTAYEEGIALLVEGLCDKDIRVRRTALLALERFRVAGDVKTQMFATAQIRLVIKRGSVSQELIMALGNMSGPRLSSGAGTVLLEVLTHEDPSMRIAAVEAAGRTGSPIVIKGLCKALDDKDGGVRHAAMIALAKIGSGQSSLIPGLFADLPGSETVSEKEMLAGFFLSEIERGKEGPYGIKVLQEIGLAAVPALEKAYEHAPSGLRFKILMALGQIATMNVVPTIERALSDSDASIKQLAAVLSGRFGLRENTASIPIIIEALNSQDDYISSEAVAALRKMGAIKNPLAQRLIIISFNEQVRKGEINAKHLMIMIEIGEPAAAALIQALASKSVEVRRGAIVALSRINLKDPSLEAVHNLLEDEDQAIRWLAARLSVRYGTYMPAVDFLVKNLVQGDEKDRARVYDTLKAANSQNKKLIAEKLISSAERELEQGSCSAHLIDSLEKAGGELAVDVLLKALVFQGRISETSKSAKPSAGLDRTGKAAAEKATAEKAAATVRLHAAKALGRIQSGRAIPALYKAMLDRAPDVRKAAMMALISVDKERAALPLLVALNDENAEIRQTALSEIEHFDFANDPKLRQMCLDRFQRQFDDGKINVEAIRVLGRIGEGAIPLLRKALIHKQGITKDAADAPRVRRLCTATLKAMNSQEAFTDIWRAVLRENDTDCRREMISALAKIDSKRGIPLFVWAIQDTDASIRNVAILLLNEAGAGKDPAVREMVIKQFESQLEAGKFNMDTVKFLFSMGEPVFDEIVKAFKFKQDPQIRLLAAEALGKIHTPESLACLRGALSNAQDLEKDPIVVVAILKATVDIDREKATPLLVWGLNHPDEKVRKAALDGFERPVEEKPQEEMAIGRELLINIGDLLADTRDKVARIALIAERIKGKGLTDPAPKGGTSKMDDYRELALLIRECRGNINTLSGLKGTTGPQAADLSMCRSLLDGVEPFVASGIADEVRAVLERPGFVDGAERRQSLQMCAELIGNSGVASSLENCASGKAGAYLRALGAVAQAELAKSNDRLGMIRSDMEAKEKSPLSGMLEGTFAHEKMKKINTLRERFRKGEISPSEYYAKELEFLEALRITVKYMPSGLEALRIVHDTIKSDREMLAHLSGKRLNLLDVPEQLSSKNAGCEVVTLPSGKYIVRTIDAGSEDMMTLNQAKQAALKNVRLAIAAQLSSRAPRKDDLEVLTRLWWQIFSIDPGKVKLMESIPVKRSSANLMGYTDQDNVVHLHRACASEENNGAELIIREALKTIVPQVHKFGVGYEAPQKVVTDAIVGQISNAPALWADRDPSSVFQQAAARIEEDIVGEDDDQGYARLLRHFVGERMSDTGLNNWLSARVYMSGMGPVGAMSLPVFLSDGGQRVAILGAEGTRQTVAFSGDKEIIVLGRDRGWRIAPGEGQGVVVIPVSPDRLDQAGPQKGVRQAKSTGYEEKLSVVGLGVTPLSDEEFQDLNESQPVADVRAQRAQFALQNARASLHKDGLEQALLMQQRQAVKAYMEFLAGKGLPVPFPVDARLRRQEVSPGSKNKEEVLKSAGELIGRIFDLEIQIQFQRFSDPKKIAMRERWVGLLKEAKRLATTMPKDLKAGDYAALDKKINDLIEAMGQPGSDHRFKRVALMRELNARFAEIGLAPLVPEDIMARVENGATLVNIFSLVPRQDPGAEKAPDMPKVAAQIDDVSRRLSEDKVARLREQREALVRDNARKTEAGAEETQYAKDIRGCNELKIKAFDLSMQAVMQERSLLAAGTPEERKARLETYEKTKLAIDDLERRRLRQLRAASRQRLSEMPDEEKEASDQYKEQKARRTAVVKVMNEVNDILGRLMELKIQENQMLWHIKIRGKELDPVPKHLTGKNAFEWNMLEQERLGERFRELREEYQRLADVLKREEMDERMGPIKPSQRGLTAQNMRDFCDRYSKFFNSRGYRDSGDMWGRYKYDPNEYHDLPDKRVLPRPDARLQTMTTGTRDQEFRLFIGENLAGEMAMREFFLATHGIGIEPTISDNNRGQETYAALLLTPYCQFLRDQEMEGQEQERILAYIDQGTRHLKGVVEGLAKEKTWLEKVDEQARIELAASDSQQVLRGNQKARNLPLATERGPALSLLSLEAIDALMSQGLEGSEWSVETPDGRTTTALTSEVHRRLLHNPVIAQTVPSLGSVKMTYDPAKKRFVFKGFSCDVIDGEGRVHTVLLGKPVTSNQLDDGLFSIIGHEGALSFGARHLLGVEPDSPDLSGGEAKKEFDRAGLEFGKLRDRLLAAGNINGSNRVDLNFETLERLKFSDLTEKQFEELTKILWKLKPRYMYAIVLHEKRPVTLPVKSADGKIRMVTANENVPAYVYIGKTTRQINPGLKDMECRRTIDGKSYIGKDELHPISVGKPFSISTTTLDLSVTVKARQEKKLEVEVVELKPKTQAQKDATTEPSRQPSLKRAQDRADASGV